MVKSSAKHVRRPKQALARNKPMRSRAVMALLVRRRPLATRRTLSMAAPLWEGAKIAGLCAAVPLGALYLQQRSMIYPVPPYAEHPAAYGGERAELVTVDVAGEARPAAVGDVVAGAWFAPPSDASGVVVYFHGNADQVGWGGAALGRQLADRGVGFFAAEFPGYGFSATGDAAPTEDSIHWAAARALRYVVEALEVDKDRVTVVGQSLGCAAALRLAADEDLPVVCVAPFASIPDMASDIFPLIPRAVAAALAKDTFDNVAAARRVTRDAVVVHGVEDEIVPFSQGRLVAAALEGGTFVPIDNAGHNDVLEYAAVVDAILRAANRGS